MRYQMYLNGSILYFSTDCLKWHMPCYRDFPLQNRETVPFPKGAALRIKKSQPRPQTPASLVRVIEAISSVTPVHSILRISCSSCEMWAVAVFRSEKWLTGNIDMLYYVTLLQIRNTVQGNTLPLCHTDSKCLSNTVTK